MRAQELRVTHDPSLPKRAAIVEEIIRGRSVAVPELRSLSRCCARELSGNAARDLVLQFCFPQPQANSLARPIETPQYLQSLASQTPPH
jgi:hypothetical protein